MTLDPKDGGFSSRKLWYAIGTSVLIFATGVLAAIWPPFRSGLDIVVGGLIAALGVYSGANVSSRWVTGKTNGLSFQGPQEPQEDLEADRPDPRPPVEPLPEEQR